MSAAAETLRRTRERVAALTVDGGDFHVACATTGARPEPVAGATFATHDDAATAADAAREYRTALRTLDPDLPRYDLVVSGGRPEGLDVVSTRERTRDTRANGLPRARRTATVAGGRDGAWLRVENAPVVHLSRDAAPVGDAAVERQLDAKL